MAHARQELALESCGVLHLAIADFELPVLQLDLPQEFLAFGDIAGHRVNHLLVRYGHAVPEKPLVGTGSSQESVLKTKNRPSSVDPLRLGNRRLTVFGMNQFDPRLRQ